MHSQVCFKNGSELINLGSIQTPLKINKDVVFISFKSKLILLKYIDVFN